MYVIYGSSRQGNSAWLGRRALEGIEHTAVNLSEYTIEPVRDGRHDGGFPLVEDDYRALVSEMLHHEDIVFVTPIYWYTMSSRLKLFIDRFSESLRDEELMFRERMRGKRLHLIAVGGDRPREKGDALVRQFEYIADFLGATLESSILAEGNAPGEVETDTVALAQVEAWNERIRKRDAGSL